MLEQRVHNIGKDNSKQINIIIMSIFFFFYRRFRRVNAGTKCALIFDTFVNKEFV
jgi:hypothetical protein